MSLVTVNTIEIGGVETRQKVALNTEKIEILEDRDSKAYFQFIPFTGRIERYLVEESIDHILNAPVQSRSTTLTLTTTTGTLTVAKENILKVYPHPSIERVYMQTLSGTEISVNIVKLRMEELMKQVNSVDAVGYVPITGVGSPGDGNIVWDDLRFPLTRDKQGQSSKPDFDFADLGLLFPQNDDAEIVYLIAQFSHERKNGSNIRPHVHFIQDNALTPVYKMDYRWWDNGELMPGAFTTITANSFVFTYSGGGMLQIVDFPEIDGSTITGVSSMMDIKLYRDDNVAIGDVLTKEYDIHFQNDMSGSRMEYIT